MNLIGTARALDDTRFKWRVRAALLQVAANYLNSEIDAEKTYASFVLQNPMQPVPILESLCAVNLSVMEHVMVDEYNSVNTEAVPDDALLTVAETHFNRMATDWASGQFSGIVPSAVEVSDPNAGVSAIGGVATGF